MEWPEVQLQYIYSRLAWSTGRECIGLAEVMVHCGENSRIFIDAADQTLPVTEFSKIYNWKIKFSYLSRNIQLQVTFGLLHLGKSGSFRHSVETKNGKPAVQVDRWQEALLGLKNCTGQVDDELDSAEVRKSGRTTLKHRSKPWGFVVKVRVDTDIWQHIKFRQIKWRTKLQLKE